MATDGRLMSTFTRAWARTSAARRSAAVGGGGGERGADDAAAQRKGLELLLGAYFKAFDASQNVELLLHTYLYKVGRGRAIVDDCVGDRRAKLSASRADRATGRTTSRRSSSACAT